MMTSPSSQNGSILLACAPSRDMWRLNRGHARGALESAYWAAANVVSGALAPDDPSAPFRLRVRTGRQ